MQKLKKSINDKVRDHIKRLQLQLVSWNEYKGALEAFGAIGKLNYPTILQMLDDYKEYVIKNQKEVI